MKKQSLLKQSIYNTLYNVLNVFFPMITIPYLSRVLLSDGLGAVNYARNIVGWFVVFASLGIPRYGVREIARNANDKGDLQQVFSELFFFNLLSTMICVVLYLIAIFNVPYFSNRFFLYFVTGIQLFLNIFNVDWFYQGLELYSYITKRSFVVKALSLLAMLLFVRTKEDYVNYALIQSLAVAGNYIFNFVHLRTIVKITCRGLNLKKHHKSVFVLLSTQLAVSVYAMLDVTMLGVGGGDSSIGYYSNVHKLINTISTIMASLGAALFPRLVYYYKERNFVELKRLSEKALEIIVELCLPMTIGVLILSPQIVRIVFGSDFLPCTITLKIFSPFIIISTVGNLYGTQLLMTLEQEKKLFLTVVCGSVINIVLNAFLIPVMHQDGAAIASVITEFVVLCVQIHAVHNILRLHLEKGFVLSTFVINFMLMLYLFLVQLLVVNDFMVVLISLVGTFVIYFALGLILKNDFIVYFTNILKKQVFKTFSK